MFSLGQSNIYLQSTFKFFIHYSNDGSDTKTYKEPTLVAVAAASLAALSIYSSLLNWHLGCLNLSSHFVDGRQSQKSAAEENR